MDCIVPGHSVRTFCASMGCLSRIGKDLYLEFDPIDGLAFRTFNDAKSAYSCFRFEPSFFEKCTAPPSASSNTNTENHRRQQQQQHNNTNDDNNNQNHRKRHFSSSQQTATTSSQQEDQGGGGEDSSSSRFSCRVSLSAMAAVVKARKNVVALRIQSEAANSALYLSFEFHLQPKYNNTNGNNNNNNKNNNNNNNNSTGMASDHWLRVMHRVPVSGQVQGQSAMAPREGSSEIVTSSPKLLLHLLDPLKKTAEAALIVRSHALSATSFHHSDVAAAAAAAATRTRKKSNDSRRRSSSSRGSTPAAASTSNNNTSTTTATANNAILQATTASLLKTETGINADEFDEFYFRDDHNEQDDEDDNDNNIGDDMPENVNSQVVLVFPIKEAKAMLQFCAAQSASIHAREWAQPLQVHVHFHWGGKPIIFATKTDSFSAELVLATLNHKLLGPLGTNTPVETEAATTTTTTTEAGSTTANN